MADANLMIDGMTFRDLDHDGVLSPYEDHRLPVATRVEDLLGRMTIAEKVGLLMHGTLPAVGSPLAHIGIGTGYDLESIAVLVNQSGVNSLISRLSLPPAQLAEQNNLVQALAAKGRLGIPVTISTDPRSHFASVTGASVDSAGFSQWPETLGLGAIGDATLVRRFGDIVRQEYRAVGFHMALSPQADLATSPRWPRTEGTFGEDPALVSALVGAYVEGVQGGTSGPGSTGVAAVVKHWVGYGASRDGFDGHNYYGRYSAFPSGRFQDHVDAFNGAFRANVAGVMPTYNILDGLEIDGQAVEPVGAGFNRQLIEGLLRATHHYRGLVVSDWSITKTFTESCRSGDPVQTPDLIAMPWGVEELSPVEKFTKGLLAGLDQFGGVNEPAALLEAVDRGLVSIEHIDRSARLVLELKFRLGLFDNPFVDAEAAPDVVGSSDFQAEGVAAQSRSLTQLTGRRGALLDPDDTVYLTDASGPMSAELARRSISTTSELASATVAIVFVAAPFELLHPGHFFGSRQHEGSLEFPADHPGLLEVARCAARVPTIAVVHLDRPAVLTPLLGVDTALFAEFGASPGAVVDVLLGDAEAEGRMPFQLPASMDAVLARPCDAPAGDPAPLFELFHRV